MAVADVARQAAPWVRSAFDDDEVRQRFAQAARSAAATARTRGKEPPPTLLQRAGAAISQSGQVLVALGQTQEKPRHRGRKLLAIVLAAGVAWAIAQVAAGENQEPGDER